MWQVILDSQTKQLIQSFDEFVRDFFEWAILQNRSQSISQLEYILSNDTSKIGLLARKLPILRKRLLLFSKRRDKNDILDIYNLLVSQYSFLLDGKNINAHSAISSRSLLLIKKTFDYFYDNVINSKTFASIYLPNSNIDEDLKTDIRQTFGSNRKVCPYCDIVEINHHAYSSMDHFFPRKSFPLLAVFSDNLVVACTACNERFKHEKWKVPIFHPFFHQVADHIKFTFDIKCSNVNIDITSSSKIDIQRAQNYCEIFGLRSVYPNTLDKIRDERRRIRESVSRLYRSVKHKRDDLDLLKKLLSQEIKKSIKNNELKKGKYELTKIKQDFYGFMDSNSDIEIMYLSRHLKIRSS